MSTAVCSEKNETVMGREGLAERGEERGDQSEAGDPERTVGLLPYMNSHHGTKHSLTPCYNLFLSFFLFYLFPFSLPSCLRVDLTTEMGSWNLESNSGPGRAIL